MTHAELLWNRFVLRTSAYALQFGGGYVTARERVPPTGDEPGKEVDLELTLDTLRDHCKGKYCVGLYCLHGDHCRWVAIDIDGVGGDPSKAREAAHVLASTARHFGLEPAVEWSGKKGWRIWIFTEVITGTLARAVGHGIIAQAGEAGQYGTEEVVVYPKQPYTDAGSPYGSLVKLPWGKRSDNGKRGVFVDPITLEQADSPEAQRILLETAPTYTEAELQEIVDENGWSELSSPWKPRKEAPLPIPNDKLFTAPLPCHAVLTDWSEPASIPMGARNNVLFALAGQERRMGHDQRTALLSLLDINNERCKPPVPRKEVETLVTSCYSRDSASAGCETLQKANLCPAAKGGLCALYEIKRERRTAEAKALTEDETQFSISPLRVMRTKPPIYIATVQGFEVRLELEDLDNWQKFRKRVMATCDIRLSLPEVEIGGKKLNSDAVWTIILKDALKGLIEEETPPEDASEAGVAWYGVCEFIGNLQPSEDRDAVIHGNLLTEEGYYYFQGKYLHSFLKRNSLDILNPTKLWLVVRDHGGITKKIRTSKGVVHVWAVPTSSVRGTSNEEEPALLNAPA